MRIFTVFISLLVYACASEKTSRPANVPATAPSPVTTSETTVGESSEAAAKRLWESQRIVNYDMTISYEPGGFLEPARAVLVKVRNGIPVSVEVPDKTDERGRLGFYGPYKTVESMFARIESLRRESDSAIVTVRYNVAFGYPEEIKYSEPNPHGFFTFRVLDFRPAAADGTTATPSDS